MSPPLPYRAAAVVLVYALTAALLLHRLLFGLGTTIPGSIVTDYYHATWNYGWMRHALTHGLDIYTTNYVFAPASSSLAYHTLAPFWFPLWALVEPLAGPLVAMTAIDWTMLTLSGVTLYALLRREGAPRGLALVGGLLFQMTPMLSNAVFWRNTNLMGAFWLPLLLLIWGELARARRRWPWALLLGVTLWAVALTDIQYAVFAAFLLAPYGLWQLWAAGLAWRVYRKDKGRGQAAAGSGSGGQIAGTALALAASAAVALALLWAVGPLRPLLAFDRGALVSTPVESAVRIPFPEGFISRLPLPEAVSLGGLILPLLALAAAVWVKGRGSRPSALFWLLVALPPLVLSAGGGVTIAGSELPLPYRALHELLGGQFRYPERFAVVFLIPALVFIMRALAPWARRPGWRYALPGALLLLGAADLGLFEGIAAQPAPRDYAFYHEMGRETLDYVVLEIPTGASSGETLVGEPRYSALQWYGVIHGKRMLNGHLSRVDPNRFWAIRTDDALLAWLGQRRFLEPEVVRAQLAERIASWPIGYLVLHQELVGRDGPTNQEILGFFNAQPELVCPVWVEGDAVVYRTFWHPLPCPPRTPPETAPGVYTLDLGAEGDERFIGWGWHRQEEPAPGVRWRWAGHGQPPEARLFVELPPGVYRVRLAAQAFARERLLQLQVEGQAVTVLPDTLQIVTFEGIDACAGSPGAGLTSQTPAAGRCFVEIVLAYDGADSPAALGLGGDERPLAIAVDWIVFERVE